MSWLEVLKKMVRLGPRRIGLLLEAAASLGVAALQVRCAGTALARRLQASPRAAAEEAAAPQAAGQPATLAVVWAINAVGARLPRDPTCLMRALAARAMLARRGVSGCIRIGISQDAREFRAHAWVEVGRQPVLGWIRNERFAVLAQIGRRP